MKTWENSEIVELELTATAEGGKNLEKVDKLWTDRSTGDLYASYASGGDTVSDDKIDVIK